MQRVEERIGLHDARQRKQCCLIEEARAHAIEEVARARDALSERGSHVRQHRCAPSRGERMSEALCVGDEQVVSGAERVKHRRDERGAEEWGIDAGDEHRIGSVADRQQPGFHAAQRTLARDTIASQLDALRQSRHSLLGRGYRDDRTSHRGAQDLSHVHGQRDTAPIKVGLGRTHPRGLATEEQNRAH